MVELLVTTALMAMVGMVSVAALAGGVRVWRRTSEYRLSEQARLIAFDQMRRDLYNLRHSSLVLFEGEYDRCRFADVERLHPEEDLPEDLGEVGYFLNRSEGSLCRSFVPYRLMEHKRVTDHCHAILEGVKRIRFSYFGLDPDKGTTGWTKHWESNEPPLAVKASVLIETDDPKSSSTIVVVLPTVTLSKEEHAS